MKIRNGFVSNSSSSSFIVAFPRIPLNAEDVKEMMFKDDESISIYGFDPVSVDNIAARVFSDFQAQAVPMNEEEVTRELENDSCDYPFDLINNVKNEEERERVEKEAERLFEIQSKDRAKKFIKDNKDHFFYDFTYADDSGEFESTLEHGEVFSNLPHIRISHH